MVENNFMISRSFESHILVLYIETQVHVLFAAKKLLWKQKEKVLPY